MVMPCDDHGSTYLPKLASIEGEKSAIDRNLFLFAAETDLDRYFNKAQQGDRKVEGVVAVAEVANRPQQPHLDRHLHDEERGKRLIKLKTEHITKQTRQGPNRSRAGCVNGGGTRDTRCNETHEQPATTELTTSAVCRPAKRKES